MKKSYFVTWLGAISAFIITITSVFHKNKKYGQKIHTKPKADPVKFVELANKGLDYLPVVMEKIKK